MISFELTEEQKLAQSMVQQLAGAQLRPAARAADDRECIPSSILDEIWATGIIQSQAEAGGYSPTLNALLLEELAVADASFAIAAAAPIGFLGAIATQGSPAQKKNLLPLFAGDKYRCAGVAIMEPDFAFDVSSIRTAAIKTRDGYRLSGMKGLVPLAANCSHFIVVAQCDGALDAFIVERNAKGVSVGEKRPNIGLRALEMATVSFNEVELPASARLGEGAGCDVQRIIDSARIALSAIMTGTSRAVMEFVMPYTKERVVHGDALAQEADDRVSPRRHADRNRRDALDDVEGGVDSRAGHRRDAAGATRVHLLRRECDVDCRRGRPDARRPRLPAR